MSGFGDLTKYLVQFVNHESFWENVVAGLFIMLVDFVLLVVGVSLAASWWQKRQWEKTRKSLAYILLNSTRSVMQNFRACLFEKDGKILLNSAIDLHLQRLELSLDNINQQMTVHLPAFLPPLTENLSIITRDISILREHVFAMRLYLDRLGQKIKLYDSQADQILDIDLKQFIYGEDGKAHLGPDAPRSDENFFFLFVNQVSHLTLDLSVRISEFFSLYSGDNRVSSTEDEIAKTNKKYIEDERLKAITEANKMRMEGVYFLQYAPTDQELFGR